jgi:dihydroxyacetone kinase
VTAKRQRHTGDSYGYRFERDGRAVVYSTDSEHKLDDPAATLHALGVTLQRSLGGTSGPLYATFFLRAASALRQGRQDDPRTWAEAFLAGCAAITELGGAVLGDRTMLDALLPAAETFQDAMTAGSSVGDALQAATTAAEAGATATHSMAARRGRSGYLGKRVLGHPDPGAEAVAVWLKAIAR